MASSSADKPKRKHKHSSRRSAERETTVSEDAPSSSSPRRQSETSSAEPPVPATTARTKDTRSSKKRSKKKNKIAITNNDNNERSNDNANDNNNINLQQPLELAPHSSGVSSSSPQQQPRQPAVAPPTSWQTTKRLANDPRLATTPYESSSQPMATTTTKSRKQQVQVAVDPPRRHSADSSPRSSTQDQDSHNHHHNWKQQVNPNRMRARQSLLRNQQMAQDIATQTSTPPQRRHHGLQSLAANNNNSNNDYDSNSNISTGCMAVGVPVHRQGPGHQVQNNGSSNSLYDPQPLSSRDFREDSWKPALASSLADLLFDVEDQTEDATASHSQEEEFAVSAFVVSPEDEVAQKKPIAFAEPADGDNANGLFSKTRVTIGVCVCLVVLLLVIAIPVAISSKGGNSSEGPVVDPEDAQGSGGTNTDDLRYGSMRQLADALMARTDHRKFAEFTLRENTVFEVDATVNRSDPLAGAQPPLLVQSNMRIICGKNGSVLNKCIVTRGDVLLLNTAFGAFDHGADNVVFEGITFNHDSVTSSKMIELTSAGSITFKNCVFMTRSFIEASIEIDYGGNAASGQTVTFDGCIFHEMKFGKSTLDGGGRTTSLIKAKRPSNHLIVRDSLFDDSNNSDPADYPGSLISSEGADILVEKTCFVGNHLGGILQGEKSATILLLGAIPASSVSGSDNYFTKAPEATSQKCFFAGKDTGGGSAKCVGEADAQSCLSSMKDVVVDWDD